jgi:hypothetical protein
MRYQSKVVLYTTVIILHCLCILLRSRLTIHKEHTAHETATHRHEILQETEKTWQILNRPTPNCYILRKYTETQFFFVDTTFQQQVCFQSNCLVMRGSSTNCVGYDKLQFHQRYYKPKPQISALYYTDINNDTLKTVFKLSWLKVSVILALPDRNTKLDQWRCASGVAILLSVIRVFTWTYVPDVVTPVFSFSFYSLNCFPCKCTGKRIHTPQITCCFGFYTTTMLWKYFQSIFHGKQLTE